LGLAEIPSSPQSDIVRILEARTDSEETAFRIVITEGLPSGSELAGVDHFSVAVRSEEDVEELYEKALGMGINATQPRIYAGAYQTFLFDPDGYKIEVLAVHGNGAVSAQADG
jgi:predicted lactoylglutathione lyase